MIGGDRFYTRRALNTRGKDQAGQLLMCACNVALQCTTSWACKDGRISFNAPATIRVFLLR